MGSIVFKHFRIDSEKYVTPPPFSQAYIGQIYRGLTSSAEFLQEHEREAKPMISVQRLNKVDFLQDRDRFWALA
jgi:hypothetical protein